MNSNEVHSYRFRELLVEPVRNGIYKSKEFHGKGCKIVNMGELFAHPRMLDVPMKRVQLTDNEIKNSTLKNGDLLFARRSLVASGAGKCSIIKKITEPTTFESSIIRARPDPNKVSSDYLFYYFSSPIGRELMGTILRQVAVSGITGSDLMNLELKCPNIETQHRVVAFLSAIDDRITLLNETNSTLEAIAQALFKSWFVDFDPVRAKSEGKLPEGMDEATVALFPDAFEETDLGMVPKGWKVEALDNVAEFLNGLALQKFPPTGIDDLPVIKIAQLRKGDTVGADLAAGSIKPEFVIQDGDVLFSWSGSLEVEIWCGGIGALNQHLFKVTSSRFEKWFYYLWTKHHLESFRQIAASKATTMGHIQRGHLTLAKVNVPSEPVLKVANALFTPIVERIVHNALQANTLANLLDTLLPRLISGQLRIADAEAELEKVTA